MAECRVLHGAVTVESRADITPPIFDAETNRSWRGYARRAQAACPERARSA